MKKRALLIGINRHKVGGPDLRGCVNDVEDMREVLTKHCGFAASGIRTLTDFRATQANIEKGIAKLIDDARPGDVCYLHVSCHGSNVPDKNGDEADSRDEILCPTDTDWYHPLTDDWIRKVFDRVADKVNLTFVSDCCHSGTNSRNFFPPDAPVIPRQMTCPLDLMASESGRALKGTVRGGRSSKPSKSKRGDIREIAIPEVKLSGCRDDQTSADARIRGRFNGAMTYALVRTLKARKGRISNRELQQEIAGWLNGRYEQVPQLEASSGNLDRGFLEPFDV